MMFIRSYFFRAAVVELVDTLALGASAVRREGSSPFRRTKELRCIFTIDISVEIYKIMSNDNH
jgi:hypothetical protein